MKVMFFPNGNTAVFKDGRQVPDLQQSWFMLYVQMLASIGIDPTEIEFIMPNADHAKVFQSVGNTFGWKLQKPEETG